MRSTYMALSHSTNYFCELVLHNNCACLVTVIQPMSLRCLHKTLYTLTLSPIYNPCSLPFHSSWCDHPNIWCGIQIIRLIIMQSFPLPCSLIPPEPKHLSQPHILEHTQHMFFPQCDGSSFTSIINKQAKLQFHTSYSSYFWVAN